MNIREKAVPEAKSLFAELSDQEKELAQIKANISAAIAARRIELNLNQKQFASLLGITQGMVSRLESGEYNYTIEKLHELCCKLNLEFAPTIKPRRKENIAVWFGNQKWSLENNNIFQLTGSEGVA